MQGFQRYLAQRFQHIGRLNRLLGSQYRSFAQVQPPSLDLRTTPKQAWRSIWTALPMVDYLSLAGRLHRG